MRVDQLFGLGQKTPLVNAPGDSNDGSAEIARPWAFKKLALAPLTGLADRIDVRGEIPRRNGLFGIDNLKLTTNERCSPRFEISQLSI